jgi:hypothetical protein
MRCRCDEKQNKLDCLRGADVLLLDKAGRDITFGGFYFTTYIQPVIDGTFIRERALTALEKRKLNTVSAFLS